MKTHTRVLVIGGGVVGCSVLYHLTKLGWSDIMLVERSELTSGSTWHAAGGFHTLNADTNMAALQGYTIRLYRELEELTGMSCGLHHVGGVTLATTPDRMDFLKAERAKHRYMGLDTEIVGPDEIRKLSPITNTDGVLGALYDPLDGHLDPSGTTHAYAKAARNAGAEIVLQEPGAGNQSAARRLVGGGDRRTAPSSPSMWSTPAASGPARSARWPGSTCRCTRWSTSIWSPRRPRRSTSARPSFPM